MVLLYSVRFSRRAVTRPGIRRRGGVDALQLAREPGRDGLTLFFGRLFLFERRHLPPPQFPDDLVPLIAMLDERRVRVERLQIEIVLVLLIAVTGEAVLREKGSEDRVEAGGRAGGRRLRGTRRRLARGWLFRRRLRRPLGGAHDDDRHHKGENEERPHAPPTHGGAPSAAPRI